MVAPVQSTETRRVRGGDPELGEFLGEVRSRLEAHYGRRLDSVILHGSEARRDAGPESDVDLLVLLRGEFDYFRELRALVDLLYPLQLEAERILSALPVSADDYRAGTLQLYRNAAHEGITL
jgi:predicted nucleotidyltransferase